MHEIEYKIVNGKRLDVLDFSWFINTIDAIYVAKCRTSKLQPLYAIYVQSHSELVELYYKTDDELEIKYCFEKLCKELKEVNPNFKEYFPYCINLENVMCVEMETSLLHGKAVVSFKESELVMATSKKNLKKFVNDVNDNINFNA